MDGEEEGRGRLGLPRPRLMNFRLQQELLLPLARLQVLLEWVWSTGSQLEDWSLWAWLEVGLSRQWDKTE